MPAQIQTIVSMPFEENSYVLWNENRSDCFVIDPGMEPDLILEFIQSRQLTCVAILNTHGHADHIAGNAAMKEAFPNAPLLIGQREAAFLTDPVLNLSRQFGYDLISPVAELLLEDQQRIEYAGFSMLVREIPGHSPGHVVFILEAEKMVLGGDVLFREGIGRTDFPGGSFKDLKSGIRTKLFTLDESFVVFPGHGPVTTIGHEIANNPFLR